MTECASRYALLVALFSLLDGCHLVGEPCGARCEMHDDHPDAAATPLDAAPDAAGVPRSCVEALHRGTTADGVVMIDPDGAGATPPFNVYCDMTTAGGGWLLVWSYGFTNYANFTSGNNAITPRPSWSTAAGTPISTTTPTSPTTGGAMDFPHWRELGSEFLVTSTINHWIKCTPGTGSLVTFTTGTISCQVVKTVPTVCTTTAPTHFEMLASGPGLEVGTAPSTAYYYFDGITGNYWPTHDPCGTNQANQLTGVANPGGAIYVRGT